MGTYSYGKDQLVHFVPRHGSFVGIDSDGCVFPTMEIKQKQCFHGLIVSQWGLERIEKPVREAAEFVNLYSRWRGTNRFAALVVMADLLHRRRDIAGSGVRVPAFDSLRRWVESGASLGNPQLERAARETGDAELAAVLKWSQDVNALIERTVKNLAPYPWVIESLEKVHAGSDAICVSQTPGEALEREWNEHGITKYVAVIAGQELGSKAEHLTLATRGRYAPEKVLMVGDAPGDLKAARANRACFFPINPGHEEASWKRFHDEAYARFLGGTFAGAYEQGLVREFEALLPETPPWEG